MAISDEIIREVRDRVDIVQVIGRSVQLKARGRNHVGLCPFHQEKTPSFNVSPERSSFYCFGCHASGDVFTFIQRIEGKNFPESVRGLAAEVGIEIEERVETLAEREARERKQRLTEVTEAVQDLYAELLVSPAGGAARRYLHGRDLKDDELKAYGVGFAGGRDLRRYPQLEACSDAELEAVGALSRGEHGDYHRFTERVTFPIRDLQGRVMGFGGRVFGHRDDGRHAKYLNSPEGELFHKSELLYGAHEARPALARGAPAILVEGYLDVIALGRVGLASAVAPCGTALTPSQARLLKRIAKRVTLAFDGDAAGQKAVTRSLPLLLEQGLEVNHAQLPAGEDPDSLAGKDPEDLRRRLEGAPLALEALIEGLAREHGHSVEGRLKAVAELRAPLQAIPASLARDLFVQRAAQALSIEASALQRELARGGDTRRRQEPAPRPSSGEPEAAAPAAPKRIGQLERQIVRLFLEWPELLGDALVPRIPELMRSPAVQQFIAGGILLAQAGDEAPGLDALSGLIDHPVLGEVAAEVRAGHRVFDEEAARAGLEETCVNLWRQRASAERAQLMQELQAQGADPEEQASQMELLQRIRDLNEQLQRGCPWLSSEQDGRQRAAPPK